jgi:hypothetical protein
MPESAQIFIGVCLLIVVFILTRYMVYRKLRRAAESIIGLLESRGAVDEGSAIELPNPKPNFLRIVRDYDSKALGYMVAQGVVGKTADGKYYLPAKRNAPVPG